MALKNILMLGSLIAIFMISETAVGQINVPSPRFQHKPVESTKSTQPFVTPGIFNYDSQVFAPIEFTNGEELEPNSGFYASIDKTYSSVSRAGHFNSTNESFVPTGTDYIWGTRMEAGWMTDNDNGWGMAFQNAEGGYFSAGQDVQIAQPMMIRTELSTFELNRIFRQSLKQGGYFEPYLGGRFTSLSDNSIEDTLQLINGFQFGNRFKQKAGNNVFGIQAGARYNQRRGRFRTTYDGAISTNYNQQRYFATDISTRTTDNPETTVTAVNERYGSDQAFVPMLDFQFELSYHISRDLAVRTGLQAMYAWDGMARANSLTTSLNPNSVFAQNTDGQGLFNDSFVSAGFIFGLEWRR